MRRRALLGAALGALTLAALALVFHRPLLQGVAALLVVEDPLRKADAIVVVAGGTPTREAAAAALYRDGWAPRVVVSRHQTPDRIQALIALGVRPLDYQGEARLALIKYGVPPAAILLLTEPVKITETELRTVHQAARAHGFRRLLLVTSPHHTRRVKAIWAREARGDVEGLVRPVAEEAPLLGGWWRQRRMAEAVLHEYLGLAAIYLGLSRLMN
jgi:uncharacterized SAM-binding protein YcdF (DUF218 family)